MIVSDDNMVCVFYREDLRRGDERISIEDIEYYNLKTYSTDLLMRTSLILFIDSDGTTKLIKNRWGNNGIVQ